MSGMSISTVHSSLETVACFSRFLAHVGIDRLADVDRPPLERHLAWVAFQPGERGLKKTRIAAPPGPIPAPPHRYAVRAARQAVASRKCTS